MPPKRSNRAPRRRSRKSTKMHINEVITFSLQNGQSTNITVEHLKSRPPTMSFRPFWLKVQAVGYAPATSSTPGFPCPIGLQLQLYDGGQNVVSTSKVHICTEQRSTAFCRIPPSTDWWSYVTPPTRVVATIKAVCLGPTGGSEGFLRGTAVLGINLKTENVSSSCPSSHLEGQCSSLSESFDTLSLN